MVKTRSQIKRIVDQYIACLEERGVQVQEAILFGSYAHRRAHEWSDIDLAIVAPKFARMTFLDRCENLGLANLNLSESVQALGYSPREWRTAERGSFIDEIQRTGKVIYGNGKARRKLRPKLRRLDRSKRKSETRL
jgi:predicted nucleotidyltransferase